VVERGSMVRRWAPNHSLEPALLPGAVGRLVEPAGELVGESSEPVSPGGSARTASRANQRALSPVSASPREGGLI
jgi:hypothetical protein